MNISTSLRACLGSTQVRLTDRTPSGASVRSAQADVNEFLASVWTSLCKAETEYLRARQTFVQNRGDSVRELAKGLDDPAQRGTALRLLATLPIEVRYPLFPKLVDLASFGHGELVLVRSLISQLESAWLAEHLPKEVNRITASPRATYEEYRRLAELLRDLDPRLLKQLILRAKESADADIREVGEDFARFALT